MSVRAAFAPRARALRLAWILAAALLVRFVFILSMGNRYYFGDPAEYEQVARSLLARPGPGPDYPRQPLYPAFMALGFLIGGAGNYVGARWENFHRQPVGYVTDYLSEFVHFFKPLPDQLQSRNVYTRPEVRLIGAIYFMLVLALFGIGLLLGMAPTRHRLLLALVPFATAAIYSFFFTQTRYRVPVEPQVLVLAALGMQRMIPRTVGKLAGAGPGRHRPESRSASGFRGGAGA